MSPFTNQFGAAENELTIGPMPRIRTKCDELVIPKIWLQKTDMVPSTWKDTVLDFILIKFP